MTTIQPTCSCVPDSNVLCPVCMSQAIEVMRLKMDTEVVCESEFSDLLERTLDEVDVLTERATENLVERVVEEAFREADFCDRDDVERICDEAVGEAIDEQVRSHVEDVMEDAIDKATFETLEAEVESLRAYVRSTLGYRVRRFMLRTWARMQAVLQ